MSKETKKICSKCGKEYPATLEFFNKCKRGKKTYLRNVCKKCRNKRNRELYKQKMKKLMLLESSLSGGTIPTDYSLEIEFLNTIPSEYKLITKYKDLAEKVIRTMRKDKLKKYSKKTQDFCLEIMINLNKFLKEQLDERKIIIAKTD